MPTVLDLFPPLQQQADPFGGFPGNVLGASMPQTAMQPGQGDIPPQVAQFLGQGGVGSLLGLPANQQLRRQFGGGFSIGDLILASLAPAQFAQRHIGRTPGARSVLTLDQNVAGQLLGGGAGGPGGGGGGGAGGAL